MKVKTRKKKKRHSQLFNLLCTKADNSKGGKLKYHVRCILDEFSNIGQIPEFEKLIATIRSREISASIILQAKSQLKGGVGVWGVVNLLEGYENDNPGAKVQS